MCVCACVCSVKQREKSVYQYLCAQDNIISIYRWLRCVWWDVCRSFSHPYCFPFSLHMWWVQALVALSPHHTWTLLGPGKGLLWVCVCVGGDSVEVSFLHFSCEYSAGKRSALSWPSRRQRNSLILLAGKHIFQLTEAHRPLPFLRTPVADWRTKDSSAALGRMQESGRAETRAHPALIRRSSANTPITFLFISFFSDKACELFLSSPGVGTEQTWIFMCTDVCIFACLSTVTCGTEKGKETDTFSISISPSFRSLQTHNVLRLMCVRVGSSVCDCKGGGIGIGRKVKHYLTALCSDW